MNIIELIKETCEPFITLKEEACAEIIRSAKSLSIEECFDSLMITQTELTVEEAEFAERLHKYGRALGVRDATEKLFTHMSSKGGADAAVTYLRQLGGEFSVNVAQQGGNGFTFNVDLTGKKK